VPNGNPEADPVSARASRGVFATTHWSVVLEAGRDSPQAAAALEKLCRAYWYPLYAYVRRRGYNPEDAQDLTQGFFARMLERDADLADPVKLFERRWATTLLERALAQLECEYVERGKGQFFAELHTFLLVEQGEDTFAQASARIGMTTAAMKMAVSRMRARCRELLRTEILQTTASPKEADEEYQALRAVLRQ